MVNDACFQLDSKGIIARDHFSESCYLDYGKRLLHVFEDKKLLGEILKPVGRRCIIEGNWKISSYIDQRLKRFGFDMGWMPVFYGELRGQFSFASGVTFFEEKFGLLVPIVVYNEAFTAADFFSTAEGTCLHEMIHAARVNVEDNKSAFGTAFDEAMADYFSLNFLHDLHFPITLLKLKLQLRKTRSRLEGIVGEKGEYVLARLKEKEINEINGKQGTQLKDYIKEKKGLRFQIIKEQLGI